MLVGFHAGTQPDCAIVHVRHAAAPALFMRLVHAFDTAWAAAEVYTPAVPARDASVLATSETIDDQSVAAPPRGPLDRPRRWPCRST